MTKVYITSIPLQGRSELEKYCYKPQNIYGITCEKPTSFPIIPVMHDTASTEDEVLVFTINMLNEDTNVNRVKFEQELEELGFEKTVVRDITVKENQKDENLAYLYKNLVREIPDNSEVYACITYGTKTIPIMLISALRYADKFKENVEVKGIYYGEINRDNNVVTDAKLNDVSAVYFIDRIIDKIAQGDNADADRMLDTLLPEKE